MTYRTSLPLHPTEGNGPKHTSKTKGRKQKQTFSWPDTGKTYTRKEKIKSSGESMVKTKTTLKGGPVKKIITKGIEGKAKKIRIKTRKKY
tara:strand:+ start:70 stop:339 length:270 start_codon:yes stop_codon:yes gene_type:complete